MSLSLLALLGIAAAILVAAVDFGADQRRPVRWREKGPEG